MTFELAIKSSDKPIRLSSHELSVADSTTSLLWHSLHSKEIISTRKSWNLYSILKYHDILPMIYLFIPYTVAKLDDNKFDVITYDELLSYLYTMRLCIKYYFSVSEVEGVIINHKDT